MARAAIPRDVKHDVLVRDRFRCRYCAKRVTWKTGTMDHVMPCSMYGPSAHWNLVTACWPCNSAKGSMTLDRLGWHLLPAGMTRQQAEDFHIVLPVYPERYIRGRRSKKRIPKRRCPVGVLAA